MKILALDIAKTTGWAFSTKEGVVISGSAKFSEMDFGDLALSYHRWIVEKIEELRPDLVAYEAPVVKHPHATKVLIGLSWIVVLACRERGIKCISVNNTVVKKFFVGGIYGKGTKPYPVTVEAQRRGHHPQTTDEADAIAILYYVREHNGTSKSGSRTASDRQSSGGERRVSRNRRTASA